MAAQVGSVLCRVVESDSKPSRNFFPRKAILSRLPDFPRPAIHAVCYLPNGNSAFKLFSPIWIHGGFKTLKVQGWLNKLDSLGPLLFSLEESVEAVVENSN
jgi:hypothetical protein